MSYLKLVKLTCVFLVYVSQVLLCLTNVVLIVDVPHLACVLRDTRDDKVVLPHLLPSYMNHGPRIGTSETSKNTKPFLQLISSRELKPESCRFISSAISQRLSLLLG